MAKDTEIRILNDRGDTIARLNAVFNELTDSIVVYPIYGCSVDNIASSDSKMFYDVGINYNEDSIDNLSNDALLYELKNRLK